VPRKRRNASAPLGPVAGGCHREHVARAVGVDHADHDQIPDAAACHLLQGGSPGLETGSVPGVEDVEDRVVKRRVAVAVWEID
jgi:hypothetical protein